MNPFTAWTPDQHWLAALVSGDQFQRLGLVVLHSLWQATAVAVVLAVTLRILPRRSAVAMQARYVVATLALLSLPVACVVTYAVSELSRARVTGGGEAVHAAAVKTPASAPAMVILPAPSATRGQDGRAAGRRLVALPPARRQGHGPDKGASHQIWRR